MAESQDPKQRRTLVLMGIESRLGKDETNKILDRIQHESKSELEYTGALTDASLEERVLSRLERKLEHLVDEERAK